MCVSDRSLLVAKTRKHKPKQIEGKKGEVCTSMSMCVTRQPFKKCNKTYTSPPLPL